MSEAGGTISANGTTGGTIEALGNQVGVMDGATVSANGTGNGGTILIGGDYQGKNPDIQNAQITYVAPTAILSADGGVPTSSASISSPVGGAASVPSPIGGGLGRGKATARSLGRRRRRRRDAWEARVEP